MYKNNARDLHLCTRCLDDLSSSQAVARLEPNHNPERQRCRREYGVDFLSIRLGIDKITSDNRNISAKD